MKREYLDMYNFSRVCDMVSESLNCWLVEELENLYRDFGQNITDTQLKYEANRLKEIVTTGKFRTWFCGDIHSALQNMVNGSSGDYRKVTIKSIQAGLEHAFKIVCDHNRTRNEQKGIDKPSEQSQKEAGYWLPYIKWWMANNVDPDHVTVDQYNEAKKRNQLDELTNMWKNSRVPGPLFSGVNRY